MIDHNLRVAICHSATRRAHLAGAEAAELEARVCDWWFDEPGCNAIKAGLTDLMHAARRRYWRELAAVQLLMGHRWEQAEALGVEP